MVWKRIANWHPSLTLQICLFVALLGGTSALPGQTRVEFEQRRRHLVDDVLVPAGITDPRVVEAMKSTPRHEFVPLDLRPKAYFDMGLAVGKQQTISSPLYRCSCRERSRALTAIRRRQSA